MITFIDHENSSSSSRAITSME